MAKDYGYQRLYFRKQISDPIVIKAIMEHSGELNLDNPIVLRRAAYFFLKLGAKNYLAAKKAKAKE